MAWHRLDFCPSHCNWKIFALAAAAAQRDRNALAIKLPLTPGTHFAECMCVCVSPSDRFKRLNFERFRARSCQQQAHPIAISQGAREKLSEKLRGTRTRNQFKTAKDRKEKIRRELEAVRGVRGCSLDVNTDHAQLLERRLQQINLPSVFCSNPKVNPSGDTLKE